MVLDVAVLSTETAPVPQVLPHWWGKLKQILKRNVSKQLQSPQHEMATCKINISTCVVNQMHKYDAKMYMFTPENRCRSSVQIVRFKFVKDIWCDFQIHIIIANAVGLIKNCDVINHFLIMFGKSMLHVKVNWQFMQLPLPFIQPSRQRPTVTCLDNIHQLSMNKVAQKIETRTVCLCSKRVAKALWAQGHLLLRREVWKKLQRTSTHYVGAYQVMHLHAHSTQWPLC